MGTRSNTASKQRKQQRRQTGETSVSIRLPKATITLIETWRKTWRYKSRSDVVRAILAMGLHEATRQMHMA